MAKLPNAADVVRLIDSNQRVFVHGGAATPNTLLKALTEQASRLSNVEIIHLHTEGPAEYAEPRYKESFRVANLFVGANLRSRIDSDRIDYLPCFLSEIPLLFSSGRRPLDVALLNLSPPDAHGYCSLGVSVDVARSAFENATIVLAQINTAMPRVHGDGFVHIDDIDAYVEVSEPLPEFPQKTPTQDEISIGRYVSSLVDDGSCLQVGIGSIPDAVLGALKAHRQLGVHSEMWSNGILDLIRLGVVDNSQKSVHPGQTVSGFIMGTREVYNFIHDNPSVLQLGIDYVNNPNIIARNSKVVAINSAVEIDLTGQVCADSIGDRIISGVGGQMDFMRGASQSKGGKPIIAIPSRTKSGHSRIVSNLKSGAGVVTTRAHVHFIVTEFGIVDLFGKTIGERARALISVAHPDCRDALDREWFELRRNPT